jgi:hypothetical protein
VPVVCARRVLRVETIVDESTQPIMLFQAAKCPEGFCQGAQLQLEPSVDVNAIDHDAGGGSGSGGDVDFIPSQCRFPRLNSDSNILCGGCADDYIAWGDSCTRCTKVNGGLLFLYIVLSFALVLFLSRSTAGGASAGHSVVLLYFAQTAMLEVGPVKGWLSWIGFVNFNGTNGTGSCIAPFDAYQQVLMSLLMPIILLCEMILVALIHALFARSRWNVDAATAGTVPADAVSSSPSSSSAVILPLPQRVLQFLSTGFTPSRYVGSAQSILLFCYTQATATCISYLTCVDVGSARVVFSAPTMDCRSDTYRRYLIPVIIAFILYVIGFPLATFTFLWTRRRYLNDRSTITTAFLQRWGPLFQMYQPRAWYWQVTVLLRRAFFVILSVALVDDPHAKGLAFSLLNVTSLLLQQLARPFSDAAINTAEILSHIILIWLSILLTAYVPPYSTPTQVVIFMLIVPPITGFIGLFVKQKAAGLHGALQRARTRGKSLASLQAEAEDPHAASAEPSVPASFIVPPSALSIDHRGIDVELSALTPTSASAHQAISPSDIIDSAVHTSSTALPAAVRLTHAKLLLTSRHVDSDEWTDDQQTSATL